MFIISNTSYLFYYYNNIKYFQNVTDEDSMVVQHILAVRKGTREATNLNKDDKNSPSDSEVDIKKENMEIKEVEEEEKVNEKTDGTTEQKSDDKLEEISNLKPDDILNTIKQEQEESEITNNVEPLNLDETEDSSKKTIELDEYFVKYRNFSYLHCEWKTEEELMKGDKRIAAKLKRFKQKMANNTNIFENVKYNYINYLP